MKLYVLSGSSHSEDAAALLTRLELRFEKVDLSGSAAMTAAFVDLGIRRLPALSHSNRRLEGLREISDYIAALRT